MAPKKSPKSGAGSPSKAKPMADHERAKAYEEYYKTLDADTLRGMCKDGGHESKGTKADLVQRLSKPRGNRARSGSPLRMVTDHLAGHIDLTHKQEWAVFAGAAAVLVIAVVLASLFWKEGGDINKFLDHFGPVGDFLKGLVGKAKGAVASATGKK